MDDLEGSEDDGPTSIIANIIKLFKLCLQKTREREIIDEGKNLFCYLDKNIEM